MGWDPVPFWIGGGAMHSDAVVRLLADYAANDNEGILRAGDLKVSAFSTPGAGVTIATGACSMLARGPSQPNELYIARMASQDTVNIAATGAGAGRSDLVIARVEDPLAPASPWPAPSSVQNGPYVYTRVISGVPATTRSVLELNLGYTALTLARIDLPASTGTVLPAHITDLRAMASPKKDRRIYPFNPTGSIPLTNASLATWFAGIGGVTIPTWATKAAVVLTIGGVRHSRLSSTVDGTANGQIRASLGGNGGAGTALNTQAASYDVQTTVSNVVSRFAVVAGDTLTIPASMRTGAAATYNLMIQGSKLAGNSPVSVDTASFGLVDMEFQEVAV
jgi:hypothetical protein